jgi:hypothetical protein
MHPVESMMIREFGGEVWTELRKLPWASVDDLNRAVDTVMGVLARHENAVIVNDSDFPVSPLPTVADR